MATTSDIRDIMNLGQAGPRQPAPKKKKHSEPQVRMTGINREVQALMGDSVPHRHCRPISLQASTLPCPIILSPGIGKKKNFNMVDEQMDWC